MTVTLRPGSVTLAELRAIWDGAPLALEASAFDAIDAADDAPVAVLVRNKPLAYLIPAATYQRLLERLEDLELAALVRARAKERRIKVALDDL
jgi:antitoxin StbD